MATVVSITQKKRQGGYFGVDAQQRTRRIYYSAVISAPTDNAADLIYAYPSCPKVGQYDGATGRLVCGVDIDEEGKGGVNFVVAVELGIRPQIGSGSPEPWLRSDVIDWDSKVYQVPLIRSFSKVKSDGTPDGPAVLTTSRGRFDPPPITNRRNILATVHRARRASSYNILTAMKSQDSLNQSGFNISDGTHSMAVGTEKAVLHHASGRMDIWNGTRYYNLTLCIEIEQNWPLKMLELENLDYYILKSVGGVQTRVLGTHEYFKDPSADPPESFDPKRYAPWRSQKYIALDGSAEFVPDDPVSTVYPTVKVQQYPTKSWASVLA